MVCQEGEWDVHDLGLPSQYPVNWKQGFTVESYPIKLRKVVVVVHLKLTSFEFFVGFEVGVISTQREEIVYW